MFIQRINHVAVLTCVVFQFVFVLFWYSPWVFNDAWFVYADHGHDAFDAYGISPYAFFGLFLLLATYGLAWVILKTQSTTASSGAKVGLLMWATFVAPSIFAQNAFKGYPLELSGIESGVFLASFVVAGIVLSNWKRASRHRL